MSAPEASPAPLACAWHAQSAADLAATDARPEDVAAYLASMARVCPDCQAVGRT